MNAMREIINKRIDIAWEIYAEECQRELAIEIAPDFVKDRWDMLELLLHHAFKAGACCGGRITTEMIKSARDS